ncbi:MAG: D-amino-acid transaminase [Gammaproteobacteria bacterium]|nr:D-amino-acid transaminase [Gammaproteobacteria bacterium]
MSEAIVYLNGEFLPLSEAKVPVLDRGFIFGDGVYEVIPAYSGRLFRIDEHLQRLQNSLDAVRIRNPYSNAEWLQVLTGLLKKNPAEDSSIYLQVTRGVAKRDHAFPANVTPTVFAMANPLVTTDEKTFNQGVAAITRDDSRWQHCNVKAITLLANILLRQSAIDAGAAEAILIRNDDVTEGAASNVFIVSKGVIKTPPKSALLLPGITRDLIVELAQSHKLPIEEVTFSKDALLAADEIWISSSTKEIMPVVKLDGKSVGNGQPGPVARKLFGIFQDYKRELKAIGR